MATTVVVIDDMTWRAYEEQVMRKIVRRSGPPIHVTWDLTGLTRVPWEHVPRQIALMRRLHPIIWERIARSTIRLRSGRCRRFLDLLFSVYTPQRPVDIVLDPGGA